jgi:hypothetical protein
MFRALNIKIIQLLHRIALEKSGVSGRKITKMGIRLANAHARI